MSKVMMPEPAVVTTGPGPDDVAYSFTAYQMEAYAAAKVREALEEAEDAVTTLYESEDPPFLVDIAKAINACMTRI